MEEFVIITFRMINTNMIENNTFKMTNNEGKQIIYEVIFTFDSDETEKSYIIYTDNTKNDEGKLKLYASTYILNKANSELKPIKSDKEWKVINAIISSFQENLD